MLHESAEWPTIVLFALVTQLGDAWFLFLLGGVLYLAGDAPSRWRVDRRRGLFVLGLAVTYIVLIGALKSFFSLPRPPGAGDPPVVWWVPSTLEVILTSITTADGHGFPSGHALGSTMVWGGLALVLEPGSLRSRVGIAGGIVALVSVSRIVLGVHYALDVVVGVVLGALILGVLYAVTDRGTEPGRMLLVAVAVGLLGLSLGVASDGVAAVGGAVGGWIGWRVVGGPGPPRPTDRREAIAGFVTAGIACGFFLVVYTLDLPHSLTFAGAALAAGVVVGAPTLGKRLL